MEQIECRFTVLFEEPFWVGIYERRCGRRYEAAHMVFGAEPKDYEVYDYLLRNWRTLRFSPSIRAEKREERRLNPKRQQRLIKAAVEERGIGTKAQQALKAQQEEGKLARKVISREERETEKERRFRQHLEKHREKHRGH